MTNSVGVAIVGAGYWGQKLLGEYLITQNGRHRVIRVCDSSPAALLACKQRFRLKDHLLTQKFQDVLEDPRISAVHIATPNLTHYALTNRALEAGKNVLVEKPMTLNSSEAFELVDLAAKRGLVLQVGHIFRYNSAIRTARGILKTGAIGRIFYVRIQWTDNCPPFPDRDIVFDLGPHPVDILNQLLETWPIQVSGVSRGYRSSKGEVAYVIAEFQDGVFAHVELSWLHPTKVRQVSVVGSEGTLVVDCLNQRIVLSKGSSNSEIPVLINNTIRTEINYFINCSRKRYSPPQTSDLGPRTVDVLEKIRASIWERPLPVLQQPEYQHTIAMIDLLEMASRRVRTINASENQTAQNRELDKYAAILLGSGLLRTVVTGNSMKYEITEPGLRFLEEYRALSHTQYKKARDTLEDRISEGASRK